MVRKYQVEFECGSESPFEARKEEHNFGGGRSVSCAHGSIDGLGSFRLTAQGEGMETMEECTAASIKSVKVGFMAAESFKDQLKSATFTLASGMVTEK